METIKKCYCCGGSDFRLYTEAKDNYSTGDFKVVQCNNCHFVFTNPRPTIEEIGLYYTSPNYMSHQSYSKGFMQAVYRYARNFMKKKKLALIQNTIGKSQDFSLLDFGCGTGDFLGFIKQNNIFAEGVEPDEQARSIAKSVNNVDTYSIENSKKIPNQKFDVITLWHVLEHIHDLHNQIDYFNNWLKPNGKLIIAVPNIESYDAAKYGKYWDALDVPRHIYHFSSSTITQIIEQHQFKIVKVYPLYLDAYYIALRSEGHKGTNALLAYIKAIYVGFLSNRDAKKTGNYSSLIYVFEKQN